MLKTLLIAQVLISLTLATSSTGPLSWMSSISTIFKKSRSEGPHKTMKHNFRVDEILDSDVPDISQTDYNKILQYLVFFGNWNAATSDGIPHFDHDHGYTVVEGSDNDDGHANKTVVKLDFFIFDGRYLDLEFARVKVQEPLANWTFDASNATFTGTNLTVKVRYSSDAITPKELNDTANISIYFIDTTTGKPYVTKRSSEEDFIGIQVSVTTNITNIAFSTVVLTPNEITFEQLMIYIGTMATAAVLGLVSSSMIQKDFPENINRLKKISIWSLWLINAWDFYVFIYHIALAVNFSGWLMAVAVLFFCLSVMAETRLLYAMYFSRVIGDRVQVAQSCKFFALYYVLLYGMVFGYLYIENFEWVYLSSSMFLFFQIALVYKRGRRYMFNYWHTFGFAGSRLIIIAYTNAYDDNMFRSSPNYVFFFIYAGILMLQFALLFIQRWYPKFFLTPKPYNYYVKIRDVNEKKELCAICMEPLGDTYDEEVMAGVNPDTSNNSSNNAINVTLLPKKKEKAVKIMQTPCGHRYHKECLREWMKNKLECPFDRCPIPPYNNMDTM